MNKNIIDLSKASPGNFRVRPKWFEGIWMIFEFLFITNPLQFSSKLRVVVLRLFGAKIAHGVIMRSRVRVRFPWNLKIGENCWIGEGVWISNKDLVEIGDNVVISQETFITTGSHEVNKTMDTIVKPVIIKGGSWITSRCIILQGVEIGVNSVITPGSVVNRSLKGNEIYGGNPVKFIKKRFEEEEKYEQKKENYICH
ncbi:colanic acid biosynthesis acetyltransferase WcaF [Peribacillus asahii]|uniref:colanic acid biosynthesis acetyltransferase WcaF n=1 Tax=Peribacillus asahii TaxID=228899 RepID=UPI0038283542